jgi:hypothetical protein
MQRNPASLLLDIENALDVVSGLDAGLALLNTTPKRWRVALFCEGYGSHPEARLGVSTVRFTTIVHMKTGMERDRGSSFYKDHVDGSPSFLSRLELVSGWMRSLRWADGCNVECSGLSLEGSERVQDMPTGSTAESLEFVLTLGLPEFTNHIIIPA